ncbi:MAG TPA: carboxypeptidase-like regulatory domain-containing protein [Acidobacteriaceae bacterium]|nr:carboxypeptidase-like regulatory domain-containing protein [Acidobacteriaceae bacterium]
MRGRILAAALAATAIVSLCLSATLIAQQATTSLTGVVTDSTGAVLPGASVTIVRAATGQTLRTATNAHGEYSFQQLSPGTWTVTASAGGFSSQSKVGELLVSKPATIDFTMGVQALTSRTPHASIPIPSAVSAG